MNCRSKEEIMELYPFYVEVTYGYYDKSKYIQKQEAVIIPANSFSQAVSKIEDNYGEELVGIGCIECLSDCEDIVLDIESGRAFLCNYHHHNDPAPVQEILPIEEVPKTIEWDVRTPFPKDAPAGTVIYAIQNLEDVAP
jgi:hypothetical protein